MPSRCRGPRYFRHCQQIVYPAPCRGLCSLGPVCRQLLRGGTFGKRRPGSYVPHGPTSPLIPYAKTMHSIGRTSSAFRSNPNYSVFQIPHHLASLLIPCYVQACKDDSIAVLRKEYRQIASLDIKEAARVAKENSDRFYRDRVIRALRGGSAKQLLPIHTMPTCPEPFSTLKPTSCSPIQMIYAVLRHYISRISITMQIHLSHPNRGAPRPLYLRLRRRYRQIHFNGLVL